ncbi:hypothetical protein ACPWT1_11635 [Ramlibacter sp. MMS24-I3-19]|uniref:hypothetical protein n=1 Tax=Ramlibacter sp. MMS24-I3-19 TaxID=3416606 RepID=UPI003CFBE32D
MAGLLAACVLELAVFALVDPLDLRWGGAALACPRAAIYTAAFFLFWAATCAACSLSTLLAMTGEAVNRRTDTG